LLFHSSFVYAFEDYHDDLLERDLQTGFGGVA